MKTGAKIGLVVAGYAAAVLVAAAVTFTYIAIADSPERQASSGMAAFGDSLLFLGVFTLAAAPPTGAGLYFLRPNRLFWAMASVFAVLVASTGLAACAAYFWQGASDADSALRTLAMLSPLRILLAPLFAVAFVLAGIFAPGMRYRIPLLLATAVEAAIFLATVAVWMQPHLPADRLVLAHSAGTAAIVIR